MCNKIRMQVKAHSQLDLGAAGDQYTIQAITVAP